MTDTSPIGFLSEDECRALIARLMTMRSGGGTIKGSLISQWIGADQWARNRVSVASDVHEHELDITRVIRGAMTMASTTSLDETGLRELLAAAEFAMQYVGEKMGAPDEPFMDQPILRPVLWSDATYRADASARAKTVQAMIDPAEAAGMVAAGELKIAGQGYAVMSAGKLARYYPVTTVDCSITVRDPKGTASGWAGVNHYDIGKIDPLAIAARALDKCRRSVNPVAFEPGHYTAILEPQAMADLFTPIMLHLDRVPAESNSGPFAAGGDQSKIGQQVIDPRLTLSADPMDPDAGFVPFDRYDGTPYRAVKWIERGVLRELAYDQQYALSAMGSEHALPNSKSYVLSAVPGTPLTTVDGMIAATDRGILVTRISSVKAIDSRSMLCSGYTRDGLWLVEHGKVSKPIKNFRILESPLFVLNNLDNVSTAERVFSPGLAIKAPAVRVHDFNFVGFTDAV